MAYLNEPPHTDLGHCGDYGWNTEYRKLGIRIAAPGHEVITRAAIGSGAISFTVAGRPVSVTLSPTDIADIILGNRSVDLGLTDSDDSGAGLTLILTPSQQRRHALRSTLTQPQAAALTDIRAEFGRAHAAILRERDPRRRMRLIGVVLHLIQDSFSPAHTDRDPGSQCIRYVRNYGRGSAPTEHGTPGDPRDDITASAGAAARAMATSSSRRYLQIVMKALRGVLLPDPVAAAEAGREASVFAASTFRGCATGIV